MEAKEIKERIETACVELYKGGFRNHLGASVIGNDCKRKIWYDFRWVEESNFSSRLYRIFNRGHLEEIRIVEWLRAAEFEVIEFDENGKQFKFSEFKGHFGGSCDGFTIINGEKCMLEFKTSNASQFKNLSSKGVIKAKPEHYNQVQIYMDFFKVEKCIYIAVNKNDDDLYIEIIKKDEKTANNLILKAREIIFSNEMPARLSNNESFYKCKMCNYHAICHKEKPTCRNCRSCKNAKAVENASWFCEKWKAVIPTEYMQKGCDSWQDITNPNVY